MKLIRAEFENFRLLRHLELDFSTEDKKKLSVIRAENETGKTTILNGLQWALYGDDALPGKGQDYRLHPIDWDASDGKRVPISAQVEFEITLSFIEATVSATTKRERVQKAIRSLLGLGVIEDALKHVRKAASEVNKAAKGIGSRKLHSDEVQRA